MSDYDEHSLNSLNDEPLYVPPDDNYSIISDSTCASENHAFTNGGNKNSYTKPHDSGHHKVVNKEGKNKTKIDAYSTSFIPGTMIRDAITGHKHPQFRVGSWNEDLFFKVKDTSGYVGTDTYCLYYDSPEQYERHFKVNILVEAKKKWTNKFVMAQARLESEQE